MTGRVVANRIFQNNCGSQPMKIPFIHDILGSHCWTPRRLGQRSYHSDMIRHARLTRDQFGCSCQSGYRGNDQPAAVSNVGDMHHAPKGGLMSLSEIFELWKITIGGYRAESTNSESGL